MNIWAFVHKKKKITALITIFIILITYSLLRLLFFPTDPIGQFFSAVGDSYLVLSEKFANNLLYLTNSPIPINKELANGENQQIYGLLPGIRFKILMVILLSFVWLTKTSLGRRAIFTIFLIVVHFFSISIYTTVEAQINRLENPFDSILIITSSVELLGMITLFLFWYRSHKKIILNSLSKLKININLFENDFRFFVTIYILVIANIVIFSCCDFTLWVKILFGSAQKILNLLGYEARVEPFRLLGDKVSIYMSKSCLGILTMILFATMVYVTGNNKKSSLIYIFIGIVFLNIVNILRFVLLFIYIQRFGNSFVKLDPGTMHYIYDIIIYLIVFVLWIIWFEKFADLKPEKVSKLISES